VSYSRIEVAADARRKGWSCGSPPQIPCNEADAARSARLKSKKCRHKIKITPFEKVRMLILGKNQQNKLISLKLNINVGRFYE